MHKFSVSSSFIALSACSNLSNSKVSLSSSVLPHCILFNWSSETSVLSIPGGSGYVLFVDCT